MKTFSVFRHDNSTGFGDHVGDYTAPTAEAAEQHAEAEYGNPWSRMVAHEVTMMSPDARTTAFTTADGLRVYDLCPQSPDLVAVAGPDGIDPRGIDADDLPEGFRWVTDGEWSRLFCPIGNCNHCDAECEIGELSGGLCERCRIVDDHLGELAKLLKGSK